MNSTGLLWTMWNIFFFSVKIFFWLTLLPDFRERKMTFCPFSPNCLYASQSCLHPLTLICLLHKNSIQAPDHFDRYLHFPHSMSLFQMGKSNHRCWHLTSRHYDGIFIFNHLSNAVQSLLQSYSPKSSPKLQHKVFSKVTAQSQHLHWSFH